MTRLFEKSRRFYPEQSEDYGKVLTLQRLYHALTSPNPLLLAPSTAPPPSASNFASIPAGPGRARPTFEGGSDGLGVTTFRIPRLDRTFTEEARYKGVAYRVGQSLHIDRDAADVKGDYVHIANPDDPGRPIVAQVFKTFIANLGPRGHRLTVCWYFRPEQVRHRQSRRITDVQTVHTPDKTFYEREVFKTSHFVDIPVEDVLERISVQFFVKYVRGRPQAPEFYPGWPSCT